MPALLKNATQNTQKSTKTTQCACQRRVVQDKNSSVRYEFVEILYSRSNPLNKSILEPGKLDNFERMAILDVHNKLRNFVAMGRIDGQPPAKNMQQLVRSFFFF